jgi:hypothetical protein
MSIFSPTLGELVNTYNHASDSVSEETDNVVDLDITVRVRLFGRSEDKKWAWNQLCDSPVQWATIATDPPQIFGDLREVDGELFVNVAMLGHELVHVLRLKDKRIKDPDTYEGL